MEIVVINLAAHSERWSAAHRQFETLGLPVRRWEAVDGTGLDPAERERLYDPRLNRVQYHKPLLDGEIGCYASHLAVWRDLLATGEEMLAVFEDDVEIDPDLPAVLAAVASSRERFDLVKLIGRSVERPRQRVPLCGQRDLIAYRRLPSLTGGYVIRREGARKLLAARQPFGRPIDVDLRHWWECELRVLGVHPYPLRGAPASRHSTIGARPAAHATRSRGARLLQQARYTALNWRAVQGQPRLAAPAAAHPHQPVVAPPRATGTAPRLRRNLVVLRAGDRSLHRDWITAPRREFDLFISYYGDVQDRWREDADLYEHRPGPKWPSLAALLDERPELLGQYEAFWFPDDDLATDGANIDRLFAFACAYRLALAQPALTRDSYYTWNTLLQDPSSHIRYTGFVEVMAPLFSRQALAACRGTFAESRSGWGLDWVWPGLCRRAGLGPIAIVDATPVRHTRPVGGELYRNHPELDGRADAARILRRYGLEEVRAVAKYSFQGRVSETALSWHERLLFWLKRLNGRRKHRAPA